MASGNTRPIIFTTNGLIDQIVRQFLFVTCLCVGIGWVCTGCAIKDYSILNLMPAPDVYSDGLIDPFGTTASGEMVSFPVQTVFYATDRRPVEKKKAREKYYLNERGYLLRLGTARVVLGNVSMTWEEARKISLLKNRPGKFPLKVSSIEEFGILNTTLTIFNNPDVTPDDPVPADTFAEAINRKLAVSKKKDVFVYVPGFKVIFENPVLVASELWHFLGFDGAFIAYSWPATPKKTAYFGDIETAAFSARNLRLFLEYLSEKTDAEQIHILGYSAGTRLVFSALEKFALMHHKLSREKIRQHLRIGDVFVLGSDVERDRAASYLVDGMLNIPRTLSIYQSSRDQALGWSKWVYNRERIGQTSTTPVESPVAVRFLKYTENLNIINVTEAEGSATGNGHAYLRKSPWVSSDVLMRLMYDLTPTERGLVRDGDSFVWTFPPGYMEHLRKTLKSKLGSNTID